MLRDLNWRTLDQRRIDSRLVLLYKVTYDLVAIPASDYLIRNTRLSSRIHPLAHRKITTLKDYYKYTYFPRIIIHWNALPHHIPIQPTPGTVKHSCLPGSPLRVLNTSSCFYLLTILTPLYSHCTNSFHGLSLCFYFNYLPSALGIPGPRITILP